MSRIDHLKILVNQRVLHKTMGVGTISDLDENYIHVQFDNEKTVNFQISALGTFLFPENPDTLTQNIVNDIKQKQIILESRQKQERKDAAISSVAKAYTQSTVAEPSVIVPSFPSVSSFCASMNQALSNEITHLKNGGGKRIKLTDGVLLESRHQRYVYSFEADSELHIPDDTQITAHHGARTAKGMIVTCEDFTIVLAINEDFGHNVPVVEITAEPWQLLSSLTDRMNSISAAPSDIVRQLVLSGKTAIMYGQPLRTGSQTAIQMACRQPITFIWGPPGTGKTETLAKAAIAHLKMNHRVLTAMFPLTALFCA